MSFVNDLREGLEYEEKVLRFLNEEFKLWVRKNEDVLDTDLISSSLRIEVKFDRQFHRTWNIFIEYAYKWKPSGIMRDEELDYLIYGNHDVMWIMDAKMLQIEIPIWVVEKKYRTVKGWDGWNSSGILIPVSEVKKFANREINLKHYYGNLSEGKAVPDSRLRKLPS